MSIVLGVPAVTLSLIDVFRPPEALVPSSMVLHAAFYFYAAYALLRYMLADPTADRTWVELLFLSFTTLSSTGLSDIVPVRPHARSVLMIEQLAGVAYIAMVVSRLVGLTIIRRA